jgi:hypothetical protein
MSSLEADGIVVFLCSPWVASLEQVQALGLALADFAIHDPVADFLFLLQSTNITLADTKPFASALDEPRWMALSLRAIREAASLSGTRLILLTAFDAWPVRPRA